MKQTNSLDFACESFGIRYFKRYFNTSFIIKGFFSALFLSSFIYLANFHINFPLIETALAIAGFFMVITIKREALFWSGFFIGIFWFYWIGLSFRFFDSTYVIPFVIFFVSFIYGLLFWFLGVFKNIFARGTILLFMDIFTPFGFNWFKPELTLINSYIGVQKWQFALFLVSICFFIISHKNLLFAGNKFQQKFLSLKLCLIRQEKKRSRFSLLLVILSKIMSVSLKHKKKFLGYLISFVLLLCSIDYSRNQLKSPNLKIYLYDQHLAQDKKWKREYLYNIITDNFLAIEKAISKKYDVIILNESAFPLYLNREPYLLDRLKELSKKIIIVTGALKREKEDFYNSTYYFINGKITICDKVILVPFGEEVPLPKFIANFINDLFFNGASDYATAVNPSDIKIKNLKFRNAICFEATKDKLYQNNPKYMIAISNNAWFTPSIEPTLQNLLLKFYSKKYKTVIFHSANMGISGVIH